MICISGRLGKQVKQLLPFEWLVGATCAIVWSLDIPVVGKLLHLAVVTHALLRAQKTNQWFPLAHMGTRTIQAMSLVIVLSFVVIRMETLKWMIGALCAFDAGAVAALVYARVVGTWCRSSRFDGTSHSRTSAQASKQTECADSTFDRLDKVINNIYYTNGSSTHSPIEQRVAIEGNIAVGKSTMIHRLSQDRGPRVQVWYERIPHRLLKLFYSSPSQYAFALQMNTLTRRAMDIMESQRNSVSSVGDTDSKCDKARLHVFDRSVLGDTVFAIQHRLNGTIRASEWGVYQEQAAAIGMHKVLLRGMDRVLYLYNEPETSFVNVRSRGDVDSGVPISLLSQLSLLNDALFLAIVYKNPRWPVRIVNWSKFGTTETIEQAIRDADTPSWVRTSNVDDAKGLAIGPQLALDAQTDLEEIPSDWFPHLPRQYRYMWKQSVRTRWFHALSLLSGQRNGQVVSVQIPTDAPLTLVDWFLLDSITNLDAAWPEDASKRASELDDRDLPLGGLVFAD